MRHHQLDLVQELNRRHRETRKEDADLEARIAAYELGYRMQASAPEAVDLDRGETEETKRLYGMDDKTTQRLGRNCLLARRLVERGVRFVQCYSGSGSKWDAHSDMEGNHSRYCRESDRPIAGLLKDLKQRGMLDSTLVIWGGEFGRTPMVENNPVLKRSLGRDHHPTAFTVWMAGGGVKPGLTYGATDDLGFHIAQNPVHVYNLQATILKLLGFDHERLTYRFQGRDFRLTDVHGQVVTPLIA